MAKPRKAGTRRKPQRSRKRFASYPSTWKPFDSLYCKMDTALLRPSLSSSTAFAPSCAA